MRHIFLSINYSIGLEMSMIFKTGELTRREETERYQRAVACAKQYRRVRCAGDEGTKICITLRRRWERREQKKKKTSSN